MSVDGDGEETSQTSEKNESETAGRGVSSTPDETSDGEEGAGKHESAGQRSESGDGESGLWPNGTAETAVKSVKSEGRSPTKSGTGSDRLDNGGTESVAAAVADDVVSEGEDGDAGDRVGDEDVSDGSSAGRVETYDTSGEARQVDPETTSRSEVFDGEELQIIEALFPTGEGSAYSDPVQFFTNDMGERTLTGPKDILPALPEDMDLDLLVPVSAYWVDERVQNRQVIEGLAFVVVFTSKGDQSLHYTVVEPSLSPQLQADREALRQKVIANDPAEFDPNASAARRAQEIQSELMDILHELDLVEGWVPNKSRLNHLLTRVSSTVWRVLTRSETGSDRLSQREQAKLTYYLTRDFAFYDRVNPIMEDPNIEDISCDAPGTPVYVDHATFGEGLPSNVSFETDNELKSFIIRLAQKVGKDVSESSPMIEATLPDGSRSHLTYGNEISDRGSNFTIRLFSEIPFTPRDLLCWETYDFERAAYLWLIMETGHSVIFSGDTGAGKTTSLNAFSMFIPIEKKIVSIEDTRELEIPHQNWVASVTRESTGGNRTDIDESGLVKAALRQRPAYIIMGEVRGEEGQDMVNAMNTGHYTLGTFHAGDDQSLINRFVQDRINADKTGLGELDVIVQQKMFEPGNDQFRRNTQIVEVDRFNASIEQYRTHETFSYHRGTDSWRERSRSIHLEQIKDDNDWSQEELEREIDRRASVLAYMVLNEIKSYRGVSAVIQAYMREGGKKRILRLMAEGRLEDEIGALVKSMSRHIDVATNSEDESTSRPSPSAALRAQANSILAKNAELITPYAGGPVGLTVGDTVRGWDDPVRDTPPSASAGMGGRQAFSLAPHGRGQSASASGDSSNGETQTEATQAGDAETETTVGHPEASSTRTGGVTGGTGTAETFEPESDSSSTTLDDRTDKATAVGGEPGVGESTDGQQTTNQSPEGMATVSEETDWSWSSEQETSDIENGDRDGDSDEDGDRDRDRDGDSDEDGDRDGDSDEDRDRDGDRGPVGERSGEERGDRSSVGSDEESVAWTLADETEGSSPAESIVGYGAKDAPERPEQSEDASASAVGGADPLEGIKNEAPSQSGAPETPATGEARGDEPDRIFRDAGSTATNESNEDSAGSPTVNGEDDGDGKNSEDEDSDQAEVRGVLESIFEETASDSGSDSDSGLDLKRSSPGEAGSEDESSVSTRASNGSDEGGEGGDEDDGAGLNWLGGEENES